MAIGKRQKCSRQAISPGYRHTSVTSAVFLVNPNKDFNSTFKRMLEIIFLNAHIVINYAHRLNSWNSTSGFVILKGTSTYLRTYNTINNTLRITSYNSTLRPFILERTSTRPNTHNTTNSSTLRPFIMERTSTPLNAHKTINNRHEMTSWKSPFRSMKKYLLSAAVKHSDRIRS